MQKIILIVVVIVVIGGGIWYIASDSEPTQEASTSVSEEREVDYNQPEEKLSGMGSLGNILGFGDNVRCEFKSTFEGQTSEGTLYSDGERFRLESTMEGPETGVITSNTINDGIYMYTWGNSPDGSMAIKIANPEDEMEVDEDFSYTTSQEESYVDFNQEVEYDCDRWRVDNSMFVPPSDIEFMDMEAMMQEAMQGLPEGFEMPEGFPAY